jgi:hypothetical protein
MVVRAIQSVDRSYALARGFKGNIQSVALNKPSQRERRNSRDLGDGTLAPARVADDQSGLKDYLLKERIRLRNPAQQQLCRDLTELTR